MHIPKTVLRAAFSAVAAVPLIGGLLGCAPVSEAAPATTETAVVALAADHSVTAVVTTAVDLTEEQRTRLAGALQQIYSKPVQLQIVHDEDVIGGIRVQIGDEVVDGTVLRRLDEAKRHLAG